MPAEGKLNDSFAGSREETLLVDDDNKVPTPPWKSAGMMVINVMSTVSIVVVNKALFSQYGFGFATSTLLALHQITCAIGAYLSPRSDKLPSPQNTKAAKFSIIAIIITRMASNVFSNLSLKYNTVGMYQLYKMLSLPCVFVGEILFMETPFRLSIAIVLLCLLAGLLMATVNDLSFNAVGAIFGCLAPLSSSTNGLITKHVQAKHGIIGTELLRAISTWLVICHIAVIPMTDDVARLPGWVTETGMMGVGLVIVTCLISWVMEWSFVLVMHYTSAMTMQVLGHMKTMLILGAGVILFHAPISPKSACGVMIALAAASTYTWLKSPSLSISTVEVVPKSARSHWLPAICGFLTVAFATTGYVKGWGNHSPSPLVQPTAQPELNMTRTS